MKTIFVVDDNVVNLIAADNSLSDLYNVYTFASAVNMFELIDIVRPDLILLDIMMPGIDGFEALKRLKADERYLEIPVIFVTSKTDDDTKALGFKMGAKDFIPKPFSDFVLHNSVKTYLQT